MFLGNLLNINTGLGGTSVDIGPDGSILALDTGIDSGTQLSLGDLLNVNTGLGGTQLSRTGLDEIPVIPGIPIEFLKNSRTGQSYRMGQRIHARKVRSLY